MKRALCAAALLSVLTGCAAAPTCPSACDPGPRRPVTAASPQGTPVPRPARGDDAVDDLAQPAGPAWWLSGFDPLDASLNAKNKSYLIPAAEIIGFEILLNQFDRHFASEKSYDTSWSTIKENLNSGWIIDQDPFAVNQLDHPYSGSMYFGFARSCGLNFWESMGYAFGGSALWEVAGETGKPSLNDQITTSFGGSFLGEAFFRTATWLLKGGGERPGLGRELGAAAISPPLGLNRLAFGERFVSLSSGNDPDVFTHAGIGAKTNTHVSSKDTTNTEEGTDALLEFAIDYGVPGKPGYHYEHPFDYFHFEVAALSDPHNLVERAIVRGLLLGKEYGSGPYQGVWGLYGGYDYISPGDFRVASTALSVGTTGQMRLAGKLDLQGTGLVGMGFGAGGTIADDRIDRDYHHGWIPQGLLDLRVLVGDAATLGLTGREYYILGSGFDNDGHAENIFQSEVALTVRVYGRHALSVKYVSSFRNADYAGIAHQEQTVESISVLYNYLGTAWFGWMRPAAP